MATKTRKEVCDEGSGISEQNSMEIESENIDIDDTGQDTSPSSTAERLAVCYCGGNVNSSMLKCTVCKTLFHVSCLKNGQPSTLKGDVFFDYTCVKCSVDGLEKCNRRQMNWLQVVYLALYNLICGGSGRRGYFRWKDDLCKFIDVNWTTFHGDRKRTSSWFSTVAGILSTNCPKYFKNGQKQFREGGWWTLQEVLPPSDRLEVTATGVGVRKKKKNTGEVVKKTRTSERKRKVDEERVDEEKVVKREETEEETETGKRGSAEVDDVEAFEGFLETSAELLELDIGDVGPMDGIFDDLDEASSACFASSFAEATNISEKYEIKSEKSETKSEKSVTKSEKSETKSEKSVTKSEKSVTKSEKSVTKSEKRETKSEKSVTKSEKSVTKSEKSVTKSEKSKSKLVEVKQEGVIVLDPEELSNVQSVSKATESCKRSKQDAEQATTQARQLRAMQPHEERIFLDRLSKVNSQNTTARRLRRKLLLRERKYQYGRPVFDLDRFIKRTLTTVSHYTVKDNEVTPVMTKSSGDTTKKSEFSTRPQRMVHAIGDRILDRFMALPQPVLYQPVKQVSFLSRLLGSDHRVMTRSITSPYTSRVLKPFIRRDMEATPLKVQVLKAISQKYENGTPDPDWQPPVFGSIDYCYVQPHHIPGVNTLCREFFWPGIDLSECLQYPDFSCVALYKKLIIGCAFMVPDVKCNEAYISFIVVHPDWRRAGIGSFMIYHLIQTCLGKDVTLHVSANNPAMLMYQKFGFKPERFVVGFYDRYLSSERQEYKHAYFLRLQR